MESIVLAIETATDACSVALYTPTKTFNEFVVEPQAHSKLLLGMVDTVCREAGVVFKDISAFAFGRGPGSFTGVRIAASVIQGLALGVKKPVIAISSLQALAQRAASKNEATHILPMIDARMHEIYWGIYEVNSQHLVEAKTPDSLTKPEELQIDKDNLYLAIGTGATAYANILSELYPQLKFDNALQYPRAEEILILALEKLKRGETIPPHEAIPTYVRNDVAQKSKKNPD